MKKYLECEKPIIKAANDLKAWKYYGHAGNVSVLTDHLLKLLATVSVCREGAKTYAQEALNAPTNSVQVRR